MLVARANGKINLGLEIIGRRPDGYHDIVTVMQEIDLGDRLTFRETEGIHLATDVAALANDTNLIIQAANILRATTTQQVGATIALEKQIPVAAGLGGGSADAAVTLLALNQLWDLGRSVDDLSNLAREIGSDVSFFLNGGTQLATGRGDIVEPVPTPPLWAVLVVGTTTILGKTKRLYDSLGRDDFTDGSRTRQVAEALRFGRPVDYGQLVSGFQRVSLVCYPEMRQVFDTVAEAGGVPLLCGAGPTIMSLHHDASSADRVASALGSLGTDARVVTGVAPKIRLSD